MDFKIWENHFAGNYQHLDHIVIDDRLINLEEKKLITSSIQQFQRGENSEGKNLIQFAKLSNLPYYHDTIVHFIREEQRHAKILGEWMDRNEIVRIKNHWVDNVFRKLRRLYNLENSIQILLTAEIVAAVYYKALQKSTSSDSLKAICDQILFDEDIHLNFQCYTLAVLRAKKSQIANTFAIGIQIILMASTSLVVWKEHRKVLKKGGYSFLNFTREIFSLLRICIKNINQNPNYSPLPIGLIHHA